MLSEKENFPGKIFEIGAPKKNLPRALAKLSAALLTFGFFFRNWELVLCSSCGQFGTHVGCKDWSTNPPSLLCPTCRPIHEVDVNDRITRLAVTLTSNQGGTVAKSIQGGSVAKSIQDGSVAKSIQDGSVTKSIQGRCVAKSIQGGSVAKSIQDGSVEKSIQDGSVTKSIQGRCVAKSTQDGSVAKSSPDGSIAKSSRNRKGMFRLRSRSDQRA